ncbi:unnamed protein product, partial [marine sediment metagenome]
LIHAFDNQPSHTCMTISHSRSPWINVLNIAIGSHEDFCVVDNNHDRILHRN